MITAIEGLGKSLGDKIDGLGKSLGDKIDGLGGKLDKIEYALIPPDPTDATFQGEERGIER